MSYLKRIGVLMVVLAIPLAAMGVNSPKPKPLSEADVLELIEFQIDDDAIIARLDRGGLGFKVDGPLLERLKGAGASDDVLIALRRLNGDNKPVALADDPARESIMVWVDTTYAASCPLPCEMRVNGHLVNRFTSKAQQSIGKHVKMGWNTITLKTTLLEPAREWNPLNFSIGTTHKKGDKLVMSPVVWKLDNGTDWKAKDGKLVHRSGPDVKEVTLTFRLFFAGVKHDAGTVKNGDYVMQVAQTYDATPPMTTTLVVNGTTLTTWIGYSAREQMILTPLLKKGKNEIRVVTKGGTGTLESNYTNFEIGGPAEYSASAEKYLYKPLLEIKVRAGWVQEKKTAKWSIDGKPGADTLERVVSFYLEKAPEAK